MPLDSDSKFPPLPDLYPEKLRNIDREGCEEKQQEFEAWWGKVMNVLQGGN